MKQIRPKLHPMALSLISLVSSILCWFLWPFIFIALILGILACRIDKVPRSISRKIAVISLAIVFLNSVGNGISAFYYFHGKSILPRIEQDVREYDSLHAQKLIVKQVAILDHDLAEGAILHRENVKAFDIPVTSLTQDPVLMNDIDSALGRKLVTGLNRNQILSWDHLAAEQ